jgi:CMD domain protein
MSDDIIDHLAGIAPGSHLDALRRRRPATRDNADLAFRLLFEPEDAAGVTRAERLSLGLFVAALHQDDGLTRLFADRLADAQTSNAVTALAHRAAATGPFGSYPPGPLSVEDTTGAVFTANTDIRAVFGERLAAGFEHVHLLVFRPRDASADALKRLTAAGWSTDDAVTLSQIVAFLAFQIRVVAGLKLLAA